MDEVANMVRLIKVKRSLNDMKAPAAVIVELEKVIHDLCDDYENRTDDCLLTLAHKAMRA